MIFTEEQKSIFEFVEKQTGHGIIDAVAGAGKTTTIMECAKFVQDRSKILFCAFNNSIANEISRKFRRIGLNEVTVKTIHALGRQILQDNNSTGYPLNLEENKYRELLKDTLIVQKIRPHYEKILKINGLEINEHDDRENFAANSLINYINSRLININQKYRATLTRDNIDEFEKLVTHFSIFNDIEVEKKNFKQEIEEYFQAHRILLESGNELSRNTMIIDYTDMLYLPYKWNQYPTHKYDFLFIDECQDLSKSQFATATKYGKKESRILAVGGPIQSIYGFTGADIESFNRVKEFTKAIQMPLTTCFRCPKKIIELAKTIRKDIVGNKIDEGNIVTMQFDEVLNIARSGDLIISRLRAPIVILVFKFIDRNIKVQIHEEEVKEIISDIKNIFKQNELNEVISTLPGGFQQLKTNILNRWDYIIKKFRTYN